MPFVFKMYQSKYIYLGNDKMEIQFELMFFVLYLLPFTTAVILVHMQSRVGPVQWLKPYTDEVLVDLGQKGVKSLLAVPVRY
jgi:protoheme ferro-lyase